MTFCMPFNTVLALHIQSATNKFQAVGKWHSFHHHVTQSSAPEAPGAGERRVREFQNFKKKLCMTSFCQMNEYILVSYCIVTTTPGRNQSFVLPSS